MAIRGIPFGQGIGWQCGLSQKVSESHALVKLNLIGKHIEGLFGQCRLNWHPLAARFYFFTPEEPFEILSRPQKTSW